MPLRILSAADVRAALPMPVAIEAMREAFGQLSAGTVELPLRTSVAVPDQDGVVLMMPGRADVPLGLGGKFVSVFPKNPAAGLPLIQAAVLLLDPESGEVVALVEGNTLTAIRTGAASGLATDLLARPESTRVAVIGAGVQARTQLEAVCAVRSIEVVSVYAPTQAHVQRFVEQMVGRVGVPSAVDVAASANEAVAEADVVCTATTSSVPVFDPDVVSPGAHINAVGSFTPEMWEVDPRVLGRARVVVDQRSAALAEAGEVIAAVQGGVVRETEIVELGEVVSGAAPGRTREDEVTLFKSVGVAVQDLCAAARAVREAETQELGTLLHL